MVKGSHSFIRIPSKPVRALSRMVAKRGQGRTEAAGPRSIDVWQWSGRKYRLRAIILLIINALLFTGLCRFTFWLRSGRLIETSLERYWADWWEAFDPTHAHQLTLIDYLVYPIPVEQVPWMMVIMGLVLATLTAVPILVSMLYRFPTALIFTFMISFVALLPWLAISVTLCCFLGRWKPLRFSFPYATALVAMSPLLLYYTLATQGAATSPALSPVEMAKLYVPWVLAIVAAGALLALGLFISWLVNYRPGAVAPLLTVMFAAPITLFEFKVGRDEVYYRLLESRYGPSSSTHFVEDADVIGDIRRVVQERLAEVKDAPPASSALEQQVILEWQLRMSEELAEDQDAALEACDEFCTWFPASRYYANALYIRGRAADVRVDMDAFRRRGRMRFYHDFPAQASLSTWRQLHEKFALSPAWVYATLRMAGLEARAGRVDQALSLLDALIAREKDFAVDRSTGQSAGGWLSIFAKRPPSETLGIDVPSLVMEARKLRDLLANNRDPQQNDLALRKLLSFDPHHPLYRANVEQLYSELTQRHPLTPLRDNIMVLAASTHPSDSRRIEELRGCVDKLRGDAASDALPQAIYELGLAYRDDNRPQEARASFEEVARLYSASPWALEAGRRLAAMGAAMFGN